MENELSMYVVYDHPTDYPQDFIVRRFIAKDGEPVPCEIVYRGDNFLTARCKILDLAPTAVCFHRDSGDTRCIVECWI